LQCEGGNEVPQRQTIIGLIWSCDHMQSQGQPSSDRA
jgi:hypothetical protein